jgi:NADH-quinone oxidoreductase subunit J
LTFDFAFFMTSLQHTLLASALAALGLWLMLPPRDGRQWAAGAVLSAVGLGLFAALLPGLGEWFAGGVFWVLGGLAILGGVGTISSQNPVYSALWFALSLLGTAALFMFQGAQFLAVATVVVYAGAIVVTFLFVLMLAQPDGTAFYDRMATGRLSSALSALAGAAAVALLTMTLVGNLAEHSRQVQPPEWIYQDILAQEHVARLGGQLFARQLLAVELAGVLLLVALVGASAIMLQSRWSRDEPQGERRD